MWQIRQEILSFFQEVIFFSGLVRISLCSVPLLMQKKGTGGVTCIGVVLVKLKDCHSSSSLCLTLTKRRQNWSISTESAISFLCELSFRETDSPRCFPLSSCTPSAMDCGHWQPVLLRGWWAGAETSGRALLWVLLCIFHMSWLHGWSKFCSSTCTVMQSALSS